MDLDEIARRTGLTLVGSKRSIELPVFVHEPTQQELVLVPAGCIAMGMSGQELLDALRELRYDPDIEFWRTSHKGTYENANPVHAVTIQPFLCSRAPLLEQTSEARRPVDMTAEAAAAALARFGWRLPSEAQWEHIARCGGRDSWAGGPRHARDVDALCRDNRFRGGARNCNAWGIWGLALGEWVADEWHPTYAGAPTDGSAWREAPGPPGAVRGGGLRHAPWQDADEAMSCHAAKRGGPGWGTATARPIIELPWLHTSVVATPAPPHVPFDEAVSVLESEARAERAQKARRAADERTRIQRLTATLPGSIQAGVVRTVVPDGVCIIDLADTNGILRQGGSGLSRGTRVTVRVIGTGGVPEVELVSIDET